MTTPKRGLEQLAADYARQRAAAVESIARVQAVTATATSAKGLVTVTVGGQGEVRELRFNSQDYRKMAPAELAHVVLETIDKARESALQQMVGELPDAPVGGVPFQDLLAGRVDWDRILPEQLDVGGFTRRLQRP